MGSQREQHDRSFAQELEKRREIQPYILLYVTVIAMCTQLHVNRKSSHGNSLIGILSFLESGRNINLHVNVLATSF